MKQKAFIKQDADVIIMLSEGEHNKSKRVVGSTLPKARELGKCGVPNLGIGKRSE